MKKALIVFILAAIVLVTSGVWLFTSKTRFNPTDILSFGIIIIVIGFAVFVGFKKLGNTKRGEPTEDEMSKKILQKASSLSYYISIYMWLAFMYINDKIKLETHTFIGAGILGMALIFAICWFIYNFKGIRNE